MDIISLPDDILRKAMRTLEIKDRMRLRLTCRAFERLVAVTHAGFFETGSFTWLGIGSAGAMSALSLHIGNSRFVRVNDADIEQFPVLVSRLFERISIRRFKINLIYKPISLEFIRRLIGKFTVEELELLVGTESHLEIVIKIAADFPESKYSIELTYLPLEEAFGCIPPMEKLSISADSPQMRTIQILRLIAAHKELRFVCRGSLLTAGGWRKVMKAMSSETRERTIRLVMGKENIASWLVKYGITENAKSGDVLGEFHVREMGDIQLIRFRKCWIRISRDSAWLGVYMRQATGVTVTNIEGLK